MRSWRFLLIVLLTLGINVLAQAKIVRSVDENGVVHYYEEPEEDGQGEESEEAGQAATPKQEDGKLLRYVDENGIISYTDSYEEAQDYDFDELDMDGNPDPNQVLFHYNPETSMITVENRLNSEITVLIQVSATEGVESDIAFGKPIELPGKNTYELGYFRYNGEDEIKLTNKFEIGRLFRGDLGIYVGANSNELLVPFIGAFKVSQGWNGKFTHNGPKSRYAIDVGMPQGTPIIAVKAGRVIDMKMNSTVGGPSAKYRPYANFIRLQHEDGTMSIYVHLSGNTQRVNIGDHVEQGQVIALSGNTGYSTGPHLHFTMQANTENGLRSIQYQFKGVEPKTGTILSN